MATPALSDIDHTLVGVRDPEAARALWARLGFTVTPRGRHIGCRRAVGFASDDFGVILSCCWDGS